MRDNGVLFGDYEILSVIYTVAALFYYLHGDWALAWAVSAGFGLGIMWHAWGGTYQPEWPAVREVPPYREDSRSASEAERPAA